MKFETAQNFVLGRAELLRPLGADLVEQAEDAAMAARSVASAVDRCLSVLLLGPGERRRVDFWSLDGTLVAHGNAGDPDLPVPGSVHRGANHTVLALAQLLMGYLGGSASVGSSTGPEFGGVGELIEAIGSGPEAEARNSRCCILNPSPSNPEAEVLVVSGGDLQWANTDQNRAFDFESGHLGSLWCELLRIARSVDGANSGVASSRSSADVN